MIYILKIDSNFLMTLKIKIVYFFIFRTLLVVSKQETCILLFCSLSSFVHFQTNAGTILFMGRVMHPETMNTSGHDFEEL